MLQRLPSLSRSVLGRSACFHVTPHRLLWPDAIGNVKLQIRHRRKPVLPGWKRALFAHRRRGAKNNSEGRKCTSRLRPTFPQHGSPSLIAASFLFIMHPQELKHCVLKEEAPAGRALSRMPIRRSLHQTKLPQTFSAWCTDGRTNKDMIDDRSHLNDLFRAFFPGDSRVAGGVGDGLRHQGRYVPVEDRGHDVIGV